MTLRKLPVSSRSSIRSLMRSSLGPYVVLTTVSFLQSSRSPFRASSPSSRPLSYASQAVSLRIASTETSPSEIGILARAFEPGFCDLVSAAQFRHVFVFAWTHFE
jgi:hypothetical protein